MPVPKQKRGKRHQFDLKQKLQVIKYAKSKGLHAAGRHFGISKSIVNDWLGKSINELSDSQHHRKGVGRKLTYGEDVEKKILHWVLEQQTSGEPISYEAIQAYAEKVVSEERPDVAFTASSAWTYRFLKRNSLVIKRKSVLPTPKAEPQDDITEMNVEESPQQQKQDKGEPSKPQPEQVTSLLDELHTMGGLLKQPDAPQAQQSEQVQQSLDKQQQQGSSQGKGEAETGEGSKEGNKEEIKKDSEEESEEEKQRKLLFSGKRGKYIQFNTQQKIAVVEYAQKHGVRESARHFGVSPSTATTWMKTDFSKLGSGRRRAVGAGRKLTYGTDVDMKILQWILQKRESQEPVTYEMLHAHAIKVVREERPDVIFSASNGWVQRFLRRHSLSLKSRMVHIIPKVEKITEIAPKVEDNVEIAPRVEDNVEIAPRVEGDVEVLPKVQEIVEGDAVYVKEVQQDQQPLEEPEISVCDQQPSKDSKVFDQDQVQEIGEEVEVEEQKLDADEDSSSELDEYQTKQQMTKKLRGKYHIVNRKNKIQVVKYAKIHGVRSAGRQFGFSPSTIRVWMAKDLTNPSSRQCVQGSGRKVSYGADIDNKIYKWVMERRDSQLPVTCGLIQSYAAKLVKKERPDLTFYASPGWFTRFLKRHSLSIRAKKVLILPKTEMKSDDDEDDEESEMEGEQQRQEAEQQQQEQQQKLREQQQKMKELQQELREHERKRKEQLKELIKQRKEANKQKEDENKQEQQSGSGDGIDLGDADMEQDPSIYTVPDSLITHGTYSSSTPPPSVTGFKVQNTTAPDAEFVTDPYMGESMPRLGGRLGGPVLKCPCCGSFLKTKQNTD